MLPFRERSGQPVLMNSAVASRPSALLTVVIPVYNLESCVANALESVLCQQYLEDITVIVIDDGSTDGSRDRVEQVIRANPHADLRLVTQANAGCGGARNTGIAHAESPYLAFLDADDTWQPNFAERIMPILRVGRADVVEFNIWDIRRDGVASDELTMIQAPLLGELAVDDDVRLDVAKRHKLFAWARVYRRSLWDGILFPACHLYEDAAVLPHVYLRAQTTFRLSDRLYNYNLRHGSITHVKCMASVSALEKNAISALAALEKSAHRTFWMLILGNAFENVCGEAAEVNASDFRSAMRRVEALASHCRAYASANPELSTYVPFERFRLAIYRQRATFLAKCFVKWLIRYDQRMARRRALSRGKQYAKG
jgi:glycosyltransferase involved in cell wall biosynthesis